MTSLIAVALGGAAGAFLIGFLSILFGRAVVPPALRIGLLAGFLGSFTTFSTYMLESVRLFQDGEYWIAASNLLVGNGAGLVAVAATFTPPRYCDSPRRSRWWWRSSTRAGDPRR